MKKLRKIIRQNVVTLPKKSLLSIEVALGIRAQYAAIITLSVLMLSQLIGVIIFSGRAQAYTVGAFVTTWKTDNPGTSANNQIVIPTYGSGYNYTVDWGDGNITSGNTGNATHTYASAGTYTVQISGAFPQIYLNAYGDSQKLLTVEQWGSISWRSMSLAFAGAVNLRLNAIDSPNLSSVTNMSGMFLGARSFNSNIDNWDVSHVTNMALLFSGSDSFNQPLNSWDVSSVTNMSGMFRGVFYGSGSSSAFNQPLSNWNTSSVTNMSVMFSAAVSFDQDINSWDVSSVTDMSSMFRGAAAFNQPLNSWDTGNVTDMSSMFSGDEALLSGQGKMNFNQNIDSWDVSKVTSLSYMFFDNSSFNQPLNSWNTGSVVSMDYLFGVENNQEALGASSFNQPLDSWDVSNVTTLRGMFRGATAFNQNIDSWDVSSVTDMGSLFSGAAAFNQPLNSWDTGNVTNMSQVFSGAAAFNQPLSNWETGNVTSLESMFYRATAFNQNIDSWDVSSVTDMYNVFDEATAFNQPLNSWDTSNVTNMSLMFDGASAFNQPLSGWDTGSVTDMHAMFAGATVFNKSLNSWDTSKTTDMSAMFSGATTFNQPLDSWDTSQVTDMSGMFSGATAFNQPLDSWDTSKVTAMNAMFLLAAAFDQSLASWNVSNVTTMDLMFGNYDSMIEAYVGETPYEDWPDYFKALYGLPSSKLSVTHYDATLEGWSQLSLQTGVTFGAGASSSFCLAGEARQKLITVYGWNILDGGENCGSTPEPEEPQQEIEAPEETPVEILPILGVEEPEISDVTPAPESAQGSVKPIAITAPQTTSSAQNGLFALAKRIPEPLALGFPWLLLALALILVSSQYYQVHTEALATKRVRDSLDKQKHLVEEQNNFVALSTHYLHTPLTVMEGEISLMVKAGTITQAEATKLKATLASLNAEAEAALAQEEQNG